MLEKTRHVPICTSSWKRADFFLIQLSLRESCVVQCLLVEDETGCGAFNSVVKKILLYSLLEERLNMTVF